MLELLSLRLRAVRELLITGAPGKLIVVTLTELSPLCLGGLFRPMTSPSVDFIIYFKVFLVIVEPLPLLMHFLVYELSLSVFLHAPINQYDHIVSGSVGPMVHDCILLHPLEETYGVLIQMSRIQLDYDSVQKVCVDFI
jgi:hypothetical protein